MRLIALLILLSFSTLASSQSCSKGYTDKVLLACGEFKDSKGRTYDLHPLKTDSPISAPDSIGNGGYIWQVCGPVTNAENACGDPCAAGCFVQSPVAITDISDQKVVDLDPSIGSEGFTITSSPSVNIQTALIVHVKCDHNSPLPGAPISASLSPDNTQVIIIYGSKAGCAIVGGTSGLSAGTIIVIVFWSVLASYFVFGVVFNKFIRKKEGSEVIPNSSFWLGLPGLIRDGGRFIVSKVTGNNYQTIE